MSDFCSLFLFLCFVLRQCSPVGITAPPQFQFTFLLLIETQHAVHLHLEWWWRIRGENTAIQSQLVTPSVYLHPTLFTGEKRRENKEGRWKLQCLCTQSLLHLPRSTLHWGLLSSAVPTLAPVYLDHEMTVSRMQGLPQVSIRAHSEAASACFKTKLPKMVP